MKDFTQARQTTTPVGRAPVRAALASPTVVYVAMFATVALAATGDLPPSQRQPIPKR